jgi:hypothetical protein
MLTTRQIQKLSKMLQKKINNRPYSISVACRNENEERLFVSFGLSFYIGKKDKSLRFFLYVMDDYIQEHNNETTYAWIAENSKKTSTFEFCRGWIMKPSARQATAVHYPITSQPCGVMHRDLNALDLGVQIHHNPIDTETL